MWPKVVGNVKLFSFYNDGGKGTGTSEQMQLYERIKIAQEGIVFTNVEVKNRVQGPPAQARGKTREAEGCPVMPQVWVHESC